MLNKKPFYSVFLCVTLLNVSVILSVNSQPSSRSDEYIGQENTRYQSLKDAVFSDAYDSLPYYKVTKALFNNKDNKNREESYLIQDAKRTLRDTTDLLGPERGQKLLQANGICFAGRWQIDKESEFSGLFKSATRVPVIARASVSFSGTKQTQRRALGLAVKLLPDDLGTATSFNVFTLHSVGGVKTKYLLDLALDNEPALGRIPRFRDIATALKLRSELLKADKQAGSEKPSVTFRSVAALATYKELKPIAPRWIRFSAADDIRIDKQDFREELRVEHYKNKQLVYTIEVGSQPTLEKSKARWQKIGQLVLTESITSKACDTQLHFAHPKN